MGMGAIISALKFFEWVLLSMKESDFRKASNQPCESNPELALAISQPTEQFLDMVILTTKKL
jgi:hypothetical protein